MDLENSFSEEVKAALATLVERGFEAFSEAKIEDCKILESGERLRSFRRSGRYDLVLALKKVEADPMIERQGRIQPAHETAQPAPEIDPEQLSDQKLREMVRNIPGVKAVPINMKRETLLQRIREEKERKAILFREYS